MRLVNYKVSEVQSINGLSRDLTPRYVVRIAVFEL